VAGGIVLMSVFFVLTSVNKSIADKTTAAAQVVEPKQTDVAGRKLRDAQRRLSGL